MKELKKNDIIEPLKGAVDYLDRIKRNKDTITSSLLNENYKKGFEEFNNLIDGIEKLNELLNSISSLLALDYTKIKVRRKSVNSHITDFNSFLTKIVKAMEKKDYLLVSDLIEFEFDDYIKSYQTVFSTILKHVKEYKFA